MGGWDLSEAYFEDAKNAVNAESRSFRVKSVYRVGAWQPPRLEPAARHGLAGRWAEAVEPFTEAAAPGVIVSTLVSFGAAIGRSPWTQVGATRHHVNEYAVLVGRTAIGRKGDAMGIGMRPIRLADPGFAERICRGFGSGEAVIEHVRDGTEDDPGAEDKRLLVFEDEFALPLAVASRQGSTLSGVVRSAWDGGRLENRTKGRQLVATEAHVAMLAGITPGELARLVSASEVANGFLNRFLIVAVRRERILPSPPPIPGDMEAEFVQAFRGALTFARKSGGGLRRDAEADRLWRGAYEDELSVDRYGLAGAACSRAEAHVLRLSMLYALLDQSDVIRVEHVNAALAMWRYCEQSTVLLFGDRLGDPVADAIVEELATAGEAGRTRSELRDLFGRNRTAAELDLALGVLEDQGRITSESEKTGGRPATRYRLVDKDKGATDEPPFPRTARDRP